MIVLLLELCQAVSVSEIATPNKGTTDPQIFQGLSSLYLFGDFTGDLDKSNYQVTLDGRDCEILSVKADEIECLIPPWESGYASNPDLEVLHNSGVIHSESSAFRWWWPDPIMRLVPSEGAAGDTIGLNFLANEGFKDNINHLKIEGLEVAFESEYVENSRPYILNGVVDDNVHGDQGVEYKLYEKIRGLYWTGGYTLEGDQYWFRTLGAVETVSFDSNNGIQATITGKSFPSDTSRVQVEVDGSQCQVTQASFSIIECSSENYFDLENRDYYEGSAGLVRETYTPGNIRVESELIDRTVIPSATTLTTMDNYDSLIYGLFKPPRTGNYVFYASFRGSVRVYLSTDSNPLNKQEIINSSEESDEHSYFVWGENQSNSIALTAGESYYLEVEHYSSGGRNSFVMGIEMPGSGQRNGFPLIKRLDLSSNTLNTNNRPFVYKGENKQIDVGFNSAACTSNNYLHQGRISKTYFNLYVYCHNNYLYALLPSYMNPNPSDLKFKLNDGTEVEGETLREASTDSQFWFVIPSDFLRTYETKPQLRVWIDNRLTTCRGDCSFQPLISSFSEDSKTVTINGQKFPKDSSQLQVKVGPADCAIQTNSDTLITCQLDSYTQGNYQPQVTYKDYTIPLDSTINYSIELVCADNCLKCYSPSSFKCIECGTSYYLVQGVCSTTCPTGYSCSSTQSSGSELAFNLELNTMQDVIQDSENSIPVLTGVNNQFHPFFHETDPYPAKDRGYYFRGTSVMQLPPYGDVLGPLLVLAPQFTVSMWIRPLSSSGTLLSKQHTNYTNILEIGISDYSLYATLDETFQSTDKLNNYWNLVTVRTSVDQDQFNLEAYYNSTKVLSKSLGEDWFLDSESDFYFSIGAKHSSSTLSNFFTGFIWEVRIYNSVVSLQDLLQDSNCESCDFCPVENSDKCLSLSRINQFWDGQQFRDCLPDCYFGCISNSTCNLCGSDLCIECEFEKCSSCVEDALVTNNTCKCNQGYSSKHGFCVRGEFFADLTSKDSTLTLEFSEDLDSQLSNQDFEITLQNATIKFDYELEMTNGRQYAIAMNFKTYVAEKEPVLLQFKKEITSQSNHLLANKTLQTELKQYDPSFLTIQESKTTTQQAAGIAALTVGVLALSNSDPSQFWSVMNNLEVLSLICLTNNQLTPTLIGFFGGLNLLDSVPVGINYLLRIITGEESEYIAEYLVKDSKLFLLNAGVSILIMGVLLLFWPAVWTLSKIPYSKKLFGKLLANYKFNVFTRYWMQCYLDLSVAGFFQLVSVPNVEVVGVFNYTSACLVVVLLVATPGGLFLFVNRNRENITTEEFFQRWGTLFHEFNCTDNPPAAFYYCFFTLKRVVLAASVAVLGVFPYIQAILNLACVVGFLVFLVRVKPYSKKPTLIVSVAAEAVTSLVFLLVIYFLQSDWRAFDTFMQVAIISLVAGASGTQSLVPLFGLMVKCCCKKVSSVTRVMVLDRNTPDEMDQTGGNINTVYSPQKQVKENRLSVEA